MGCNRRFIVAANDIIASMHTQTYACLLLLYSYEHTAIWLHKRLTKYVWGSFLSELLVSYEANCVGVERSCSTLWGTLQIIYGNFTCCQNLCHLAWPKLRLLPLIIRALKSNQYFMIVFNLRVIDKGILWLNLVLQSMFLWQLSFMKRVDN